MTARHIGGRVGIDSELEDLLEKKNLDNTQTFLCKTAIELMVELGIFYDDVKVLMSRVRKHIIPKFRTLGEISRPPGDDITTPPLYFKTGLCFLDEYLKGGIRSGTITEIIGPSSVGKTQFCHLLAVETLFRFSELGEDHQKVLYIDSHNTFSSKRFVEIASFLYSKHLHAIDHHLCRILTLQFFDGQGFFSFMTHQLEELIILENIKLVIVDSITGMIKSEYDSTSILSRQKFLYLLASKFKTIAEKFNISIFISNQATTSYKNNDVVMSPFGILWSHCINTRLSMQYNSCQFNLSEPLVAQLIDASLRSHGTQISSPSEAVQIRFMTIEKSPVSPVISFPYFIHEGGIGLLKIPTFLNPTHVPDPNSTNLDHYIMTPNPSNYCSIAPP